MRKFFMAAMTAVTLFSSAELLADTTIASGVPPKPALPSRTSPARALNPIGQVATAPIADASSTSSSASKPIQTVENSNPAIIEFRLSYFLPSSSTLKNLCNHGGIDYQLTGTIPVYNGSLFWAKCFNVWWAADYFYKSGHSSHDHIRTNISIVPLTLGMKYIYAKGRFRPYVGAGMKYYFVNVHNHSSHVIKHIQKNGMGGVVEGGMLYFVNKHLNLDVFTSYSFRNFGAPHTSRPNIQPQGLKVSGWNFGGGIGYMF